MRKNLGHADMLEVRSLGKFRCCEGTCILANIRAAGRNSVRRASCGIDEESANDDDGVHDSFLFRKRWVNQLIIQRPNLNR